MTIFDHIQVYKVEEIENNQKTLEKSLTKTGSKLAASAIIRFIISRDFQ